MDKLIQIGKIEPKNSKDIEYSKIGLGFEKLDRDAFNPEKAYDKVAACGVKLARIQSGWQKTEREKGVYNFAWLDTVVDNLISRGVEPWLCLCYGNDLYTDAAKTVYGAVGCPPIFTEEEKAAWANYVKATAEHFKGRIRYFEVWNEPDGDWCWKHGNNGEELGRFTIDTAKAVREVYPEAKIIGGVVCQKRINFLNDALSTGMADFIDYISFHEYTHDETDEFQKVDAFRALIKEYNPKVELIQGESGTQSRRGGCGANRTGAWTPELQAKQLARHTMADLICDVHFMSYFSCVDMKEALNGIVGDESSYKDFGYFGILGADFDENGNATGEYTEKPSYYVLQNIASLFCGDIKSATHPFYITSETNRVVYDNTPARKDLTMGVIEKDGAKAIIYWLPTNIMTTSIHTFMCCELFTGGKEVKVIDIMNGEIYKIPDEDIEDKGNGVVLINELPVKDTPLIITIGDFYK